MPLLPLLQAVRGEVAQRHQLAAKEEAHRVAEHCNGTKLAARTVQVRRLRGGGSAWLGPVVQLCAAALSAAPRVGPG
jgi:hypothetical protein